MRYATNPAIAMMMDRIAVNMPDQAEVQQFVPEPGDRLLLATDGLTNHVEEEDLREGPNRFPDPQDWVDHLVTLALERGSRDNVTCIVIAFAEA